MSNWCLTSRTFYTDKGKKDTLERLRSKVSNPEVTQKTDFGMAWLGNILLSHGIESEVYPCRGEVCHVGEIKKFENGGVCFEITENTISRPMEELWRNVVTMYPDVLQVSISKAPEGNLYVNTDEDGLFYRARYRIDFCDLEDANDALFGGSIKESVIFKENQYEDVKSLWGVVALLTGRGKVSFRGNLDSVEEYLLEKAYEADAYCQLLRFTG